MTATHDELAYAVAMESIASIRQGKAPWNSIFSIDCHVTSSRDWPVPDFVLYDETKKLSVAAEFKPPGQPKREYLTGLGQAIAYTKDYDYGMLVVPDIADDGYAIAGHIQAVMDLEHFSGVPIGIIGYDASSITADHAGADVLRFFSPREVSPAQKAQIGTTFYAKWREISPEEMACFLRKLYEEETERQPSGGTIRDRAWERVWADIQAGRLHHWGGGVRHVGDTRTNYVGWMKNWRNFMAHVGWMETDGRLTEAGLTAMQKAHVYGANSQMFLRVVARALLVEGKHLILISAINEYQDQHLSDVGPFENEAHWLMGIEDYLEDKGLLKRNPGRHTAAARASERGFLKAEKQLWKQIGVVTPKGSRVYHKGRGFVFDWARITELVTA